MKSLFSIIFLSIFGIFFSQERFKLSDDLIKKYDYIAYPKDNVAIIRDKKQKEGVIDSLGNVLVEPKFSYISDFENGFAEAGNNIKGAFKRGVINKKGEIIVPFSYTYLYRCCKDRIRVGKGNKYGLIDYQNKLIIPIFYDNIYESYHDKIYLVEQKNKFAYFDENGKVITKFEFINADRFYHGKASVVLENNSGTLINQFGEKILKPIPNTRIINYDNENYYLVSNTKTKKVGVISNSGKTIFESIYDEIEIIDDRFRIKKNNQYALYNVNKRQTTKFYDFIFPSLNNKFEVYDGKKKGVIDKDDNIFLPIIYSDLFVLNEKFWVLKKDNFYEILDDNKKVIVPEEYKFYSVTSKSIIAEKDGKFYIISGETFNDYKQINGIDTVFEKWIVKDFDSSFLKISNNNKFGVMNLSGRILLEPQYEDIIVYYSVTPFGAKKNGKWGLVNENNVVEKDFVYDKIDFVKETIYLFKGKKKEMTGNRFSKNLLED